MYAMVTWLVFISCQDEVDVSSVDHLKSEFQTLMPKASIKVKRASQLAKMYL